MAVNPHAGELTRNLLQPCDWPHAAVCMMIEGVLGCVVCCRCTSECCTSQRLYRATTSTPPAL